MLRVGDGWVRSDLKSLHSSRPATFIRRQKGRANLIFYLLFKPDSESWGALVELKKTTSNDVTGYLVTARSLHKSPATKRRIYLAARFPKTQHWTKQGLSLKMCLIKTFKRNSIRLNTWNVWNGQRRVVVKMHFTALSRQECTGPNNNTNQRYGWKLPRQTIIKRTLVVWRRKHRQRGSWDKTSVSGQGFTSWRRGVKVCCRGDVFTLTARN